MKRYRIETDSMGPVRVPARALFGAQTQRAVENFPLGGTRLPRPFLGALGLIKACAAEANRGLGLLPVRAARAIAAAALEVARGRHDAHFPVDVFQTGSGTSTNMNANEVIAALASRRTGTQVHPNDHVNMCQSSNDVIPTAIHVSACLEVSGRLLPALAHLRRTIDRKARSLRGVVKTGRTHLMDALPIRMDQELSAWSAQAGGAEARLRSALSRLAELAIGGTAVGTGVNAPAGFAPRVIRGLRRRTGFPFQAAPNRFEKLAAVDAAVELSGQLKTTALSLMKIANDLRWMNSGPEAGLGEISLPALQPGSSIMPGKVNPVIPEAVAMACAQVIGYDAAITVAGQSGSFQLNGMLPLIAHDLLGAVALLAGAAELLADKAIRGFTVHRERLAAQAGRNPVLATALNPRIGYARAAEVAKKASRERRSVVEVAAEMTDIPRAELERLLDPKRLTG
ncbi:MAG: aspartate ammonia-lyase [Elusimicrobia bacterium GWA2_69_24]|nr:MAG: aspartate ammonia-lyase [Elusimicrobia bacterium GWA2_69_24]HBL15403.1 aspartate ammonia-lyase [Elusimicrobiota bacterium]